MSFEGNNCAEEVEDRSDARRAALAGSLGRPAGRRDACPTFGTVLRFTSLARRDATPTPLGRRASYSHARRDASGCKLVRGQSQTSTSGPRATTVRAFPRRHRHAPRAGCPSRPAWHCKGLLTPGRTTQPPEYTFTVTNYLYCRHRPSIHPSVRGESLKAGLCTFGRVPGTILTEECVACCARFSARTAAGPALCGHRSRTLGAARHGKQQAGADRTR